MSLPLLFGQKRGGRRLTTFSHSHPTSLSSNSALCLWKPNLLLMLSELVNVISDVNSDVVRSLTELLFPVKISVNHPVAAVRGGGSDFRSMFCSFALRPSFFSSSLSFSSSCECVCFSPKHRAKRSDYSAKRDIVVRRDGVSLLPFQDRKAGTVVTRTACQQGRKVQSVGGKMLPVRSRSVNVANVFLLSLSLVLISLSEWFVLHCYHRKEFRRKGC